MSKIVTVVLICRRHKPIDLIYTMGGNACLHGLVSEMTECISLKFGELQV
jgi:hypothetical protein